MLKRELLRFFASVLFFSRIRVPLVASITDEHFRKAIRYLPWVGFMISSASAVIMYFSCMIVPKSIAVLVGLTVNTLLTGALHEDGLADVCDGFGGGFTKQRILDIMKDSHIGTYGVIALILAFLFRYTALAEMPRYFLAVFFIAANTLSRYTLVTIMYQYPYARSDDSSKAKAVIGNYTIADLFIAAIPLIPAFLLTGSKTCLLLIIPVWIAKWIFAKFCYRKIGGYTGDCLGAMQQITEIMFYIGALVWLRFTW
jgi:adenosylcobinamide-GDP ribazoletransferase